MTSWTMLCVFWHKNEGNLENDFLRHTEIIANSSDQVKDLQRANESPTCPGFGSPETLEM